MQKNAVDFCIKHQKFPVYSRRLTAKNRALYKQIMEQDRLSEKMEILKLQLQKPDSVHHTEKDNKSAELSPENETQKLFSALNDLLIKEKWYTNPNLNRKELASMLGTNSTYLANAVREYADLTIQDYINRFRLSSARRMLVSENTYTIDHIAEICGFSSSRTFYRLFRGKYNINPSEFRRFAKEGQDDGIYISGESK